MSRLAGLTPPTYQFKHRRLDAEETLIGHFPDLVTTGREGLVVLCECAKSFADPEAWARHVSSLLFGGKGPQECAGETVATAGSSGS